MNNAIIGNSYSIRFNFESAGNLLYAFAKMTNMKKNEDGEYSLLSIPFAQYVKGDFDFAKNVVIDNRNSIAFHVGAGIAVPYGNATIVPLKSVISPAVQTAYAAGRYVIWVRVCFPVTETS